MLKKKLPPDRFDLSHEYQAVSRVVDDLYANNNNQSTERRDQIIQSESSSILLPSNVDAKVSADNLKRELFGKYKCKHLCSPHLMIDSKVSVIDSSDKRRKTSKNEECKVKRQDMSSQRVSDKDNTENSSVKVKLPPYPKENHIKKPNSSELVNALDVLLKLSNPMIAPIFKFEPSKSAAVSNHDLLKANNYDLHSLLNPSEGNCVTSYGSEFKSIKDLEKLLHRHPRWEKLKLRLEKGSDWPINDIEAIVRKKDVDFAIKRGNHKSAIGHLEFLQKALIKEIKKGWVLVLPLESGQDIPNLIISPLGVTEQMGVSASGEFVKKLRITHDLSFQGNESDESTNSRVVEDELEPCLFGYTLLRVIHRIVHLRKLHPKSIIWIRKEDLKSAYRRMHMHADTAVKTAVQLRIEGNELLLISLRLPFGGSPCPSEFCLLSDVITDTINDLLACDTWNPDEVHSKYIEMIPKPKPLPATVPFAQALETSIIINEGDICKSDVFVDDIITVGVNERDNLKRITAAPCSVMHALAHSCSSNVHLPRDDIIADDKNEAEGAPEENKIVLGWSLNSRSLTIHLPVHKHKAWSSQLSSFMTRKSANLKDIQSLLGRLENIAIIIPMMGHFLNNIRQMEIKANITNKNQFLSKRVKDDLVLAQKFIDKAYNGVNMNTVTFRVPTITYINDASEHGLGGFACHGRAWSWEIPENLRGRAHINLLEFMAQLISIWIDSIEGRIVPLDCLLGMGDNTASMGWLRRSNFRENDENDVEWLAKQKIARKVAELVLEKNACLYRQWFKGEANTVADSLSRDGYFLSNKTHKDFLLATVPHQVPANFNISPISKEIVLYISSILLLMPVKKLRLKAQKPSDLARSNVGLLSSLASGSTIYSSKISHAFNKTSSCQLSPNPCEKPPSLLQIKMNWWKAQSMPPSHMWLRPSGQTTGLTQDWTLTEKCRSSSKSNSEDIAIKMVPKESKKHCP